MNGGWLPPGLTPPPTQPVPGGCTTPDPFVSIGGGICVNGGWKPRGLDLAQSHPLNEVIAILLENKSRTLARRLNVLSQIDAVDCAPDLMRSVDRFRLAEPAESMKV